MAIWVVSALLFFMAAAGIWRWAGGTRPVQLSIVFIGRYTDRKPPEYWATEKEKRAELKPLPELANPPPSAFESIHERCLEQLVEQINRTRSDVRLHLEVLDSGSMGAVLRERYETLALRRDMLVIIDNSWGAELAQAAGSIAKVASPIVFLNGDKNDINFGDGRLFLGSGDTVLSEMLPMLRDLIAQPTGTEKPATPKWIFVAEAEYDLTQKFTTAFQNAKLTPDGTVPLAGTENVPSRQDFRDAKLSIMQTFTEPRSKDPKVILLNTHNVWGTALIDWIDNTFHNTSILTFQSSISNTGVTHFGKDPTNRLIVSSYFGKSVPTSLLVLLNSVRERWPETFARDDAVFFVRRCLAAVELAVGALDKIRPQQLHADDLRSQRLASILALNCLQPPQTSLGQLTFKTTGEEFGQNHFVLYQDRMMSANPSQVNLKHTVIPNVQFGFQDFKLSSVKVEDNRFKADFYFWLRRPTDKLSTLVDASNTGDLEVQFVGFDPEKFHQRLVARNPIPNGEDLLYQISGNFASLLDGRWFPFDRQTLKIDLRATKPGHELSISPDTYYLLQVGDEGQSVDGWDIKTSYIAVDRVPARKIPISNPNAGMRSEYSTPQVVVEVKRRLWNSLMLVFAPLILLALASLAVLFMVVIDPAGAGPHDAAETLKTQTELTLGCTLAVVTYLVSYAALAPRLDSPIFSDYLVGGTLLICVMNFVFVVAVSKRENHWVLRYLSHDRYRLGATIATALMFCGWLLAGILH
jgi:hypothetical protein